MIQDKINIMPKPIPVNLIPRLNRITTQKIPNIKKGQQAMQMSFDMPILFAVYSTLKISNGLLPVKIC